MLSRKFLSWLRKLAAERTQEEVEALTGMDQSRISTHLAKPPNQGADISLDRLQAIAARYRPGKPASDFLREIEQERDPEDRPESQRRAETAYRAWLRLFEYDPPRAERVLANMAVQEDLEITELISRVVHLIVRIEEPHERQRAVVNALADFEKVSRGAKFRRRVAAYLQEYENIH